MGVIATCSETVYHVLDIASVTMYYKLQASTLTPPSKPTTATPGGWTTTEPTYTEGSTNSLYICQKVTFSDGTFEYSDVSLSSSYEAAKAAYNKAVVAATTATNYLSYDASTGLDVSYTGTSAKTRIKGDGVEIFDGDGNSAAFFGTENNAPTSRVGYTSSGHSVTDANGMRIYGGNGTTQIANLGYGEGAAESGTAIAPYFTFGRRRVSDNPVTDIGNYSIAEGLNTAASGSYSHAEGRDTTAVGGCSHAEGKATIARGEYGHAEGYYTTANGFASHASGRETSALSNYQTVIGKYNLEDSNDTYAFIIGNGIASRSNALTVEWNGTLRAYGEYQDAAGATIFQRNKGNDSAHTEYPIFWNNQYILRLATKATSTTSTGTAFILGNGMYAAGGAADGSIAITNTAVYLAGGCDATSRFITSPVVYLRTYNAAANVVVTSNGYLGRSTSSSIKYKRDVEYLTNEGFSAINKGESQPSKKGCDTSLDSVLNIPVVTFKYNEGYVTGESDFDYDKPIAGFIAEDVARVCPECATYIEDENGDRVPEAWDAKQLLVRMLYVLQKQQDEIKQLKERMAS